MTHPYDPRHFATASVRKNIYRTLPAPELFNMLAINRTFHNDFAFIVGLLFERDDEESNYFQQEFLRHFYSQSPEGRTRIALALDEGAKRKIRASLSRDNPHDITTALLVSSFIKDLNAFDLFLAERSEEPDLVSEVLFFTTEPDWVALNLDAPSSDPEQRLDALIEMTGYNSYPNEAGDPYKTYLFFRLFERLSPENQKEMMMGLMFVNRVVTEQTTYVITGPRRRSVSGSMRSMAIAAPFMQRWFSRLTRAEKKDYLKKCTDHDFAWVCEVLTQSGDEESVRVVTDMYRKVVNECIRSGSFSFEAIVSTFDLTRLLSSFQRFMFGNILKNIGRLNLENIGVYYAVSVRALMPVMSDAEREQILKELDRGLEACPFSYRSSPHDMPTREHFWLKMLLPLLVHEGFLSPEREENYLEFLMAQLHLEGEGDVGLRKGRMASQALVASYPFLTAEKKARVSEALNTYFAQEEALLLSSNILHDLTQLLPEIPEWIVTNYKKIYEALADSKDLNGLLAIVDDVPTVELFEAICIDILSINTVNGSKKAQKIDVFLACHLPKLTAHPSVMERVSQCLEEAPERFVASRLIFDALPQAPIPEQTPSLQR